MENIKFRAWDFKREEMIYNLFLTSNGLVARVFNSGYESDYSLEEFLPLQYTNIKDKYDKDIYEGDILVLTSPTGYYGIHPYGMPEKNANNELFVVTKSPAGYLLRHVSDYKQHKENNDGHQAPNGFYYGWKPIDNYTFWNQQRHFTIQGNIYENPELLNSL